MSYIVRIYCDDKLYSLDLSNLEHATIGNDSSDTLRIVGNDLRKAHITFTKSNISYIIKARGMYDRDSSPISSDIISVGKTYSIDGKPDVYIAIHPKQADGNKTIGLDNVQEIYIGRSSQNNIILHNKRTSSNHCKIYRTSGLLKIRDLRSSNGTYVNGKRINEKILVDGDIINISVYELVIKNNTLTFYNVGDELELNMDDVEEKRDSGTVSMFDVNINVSSSDEQYGIHIKQQIKNGTKSVFDID